MNNYYARARVNELTDIVFHALSLAAAYARKESGCLVRVQSGNNKGT